MAELNKPLPVDGVTKRKKRHVTRLHRVQRLGAAVRRRKVWDLALKGGDCRKIAATVGVSAMQVSRDLRYSLAEEAQLTARSIEEHRTIEAARLDDLQVNLAHGVIKGSVPAIREARNISESRRKLYGVDAPVRAEISGPAGGPIQTQSQVAVMQLSDEALLDRLQQVASAIRGRPLLALPPIDVAPSTPAVETPAAAAYAAVLATRSGNGNGGDGS